MTKTVNPYTNRMIKVGGPTYMKLVFDNKLVDGLFIARCSPRNEGENDVYFSPSRNGWFRILTDLDEVKDKCRIHKTKEFKYAYNKYRNDIYNNKEYSSKLKTELVDILYNKYCLAIMDEAWAT
jgi:hypothetical protein